MQLSNWFLQYQTLAIANRYIDTEEVEQLLEQATSIVEGDPIQERLVVVGKLINPELDEEIAMKILDINVDQELEKVESEILKKFKGLEKSMLRSRIKYYLPKMLEEDKYARLHDFLHCYFDIHGYHQEAKYAERCDNLKAGKKSDTHSMKKTHESPYDKKINELVETYKKKWKFG